MQNTELKIIYEDADFLVIDKPAGIVVFPETNISEKTLIDLLLEKYPDFKNTGSPPRYGIVHRLDKDTSGILLAAKNNQALFFLQKQFSSFAKSYGGSAEAFGEGGKKRHLEKILEKRYIALVIGNLKNDQGTIETLIGRAPKNRKKQKVYLTGEPGSERKRKAITGYKVIEKFPNYTLIEASPKTGRKHQIRCHFAYINHPIAGDKVYGFKNQPCPKGLSRHFLHARYLKIKLPDKKTKEFFSPLPDELKIILEKLK